MSFRICGENRAPDCAGFGSQRAFPSAPAACPRSRVHSLPCRIERGFPSVSPPGFHVAELAYRVKYKKDITPLKNFEQLELPWDL